MATLETLEIEFKAQMGNLASQMNAVKSHLLSVNKGASTAGASMRNLARMAKMFLTVYVGRAMLRVGKESLAMANEVIESENLFNVSFGGMSNTAREWSDSFGSSLGLNAYQLRKNAGMFYVMFQSMKLGTQESYKMATGLVELANDMASFYNIDPQQAMEKLQSGVTGMPRPLKELGILVDESTIKETSFAKAIKASGREMTEQEKVIARYRAIMEQTSAAQGDLARTIESPANQIRLLNSVLDQAKVALGQAFQPIQSVVIPILISLANAAKTAAQALAFLLGGLGGFRSSTGGKNLAASLAGTAVKAITGANSTNNLSDALDGAAKSYGSAGRAAKQASKDMNIGLKSFDEINKITEDAADKADEGGGGGGGVDEIEVPDTTPITGYVDILETVSAAVAALAAKFAEYKFAFENSLFAQALTSAWETLKGLVGAWTSDSATFVSGLEAITAAWIAFKITGNPAIALAVGAIVYIAEQINQAAAKLREARLSEAFGNIKLSVDEINTIITQTIGGKTQQMLKDLKALKTESDDALAAYSQSVSHTKRVELIIQLLPELTGFDVYVQTLAETSLLIQQMGGTISKDIVAYLNAKLEGKQISQEQYDGEIGKMNGYLETAKTAGEKLETEVPAMITAALEGDNTIDTQELKDISGAIDANFKNAVAALEALKTMQEAQINADLKAGIIDKTTAETKLAELNANVDAELARLGGVKTDLIATLTVNSAEVVNVAATIEGKLNAVQNELMLAGKSITVPFMAYLDAQYAEGKYNYTEYKAKIGEMNGIVAIWGGAVTTFRSDAMAYVDAAWKDGEVNADELIAAKGVIEKKAQSIINGLFALQTWAKGLIQADLDAGLLTPEEAEAKIVELEGVVQGQIDGTRAAQVTAIAALTVSKWDTSAWTQEQKDAYVTAIQGEIDAHVTASTTAQATVTASFTALLGEGWDASTINQGITDIFAGADAKASAAAQNINDLITQGLKVEFTPELIAQINASREVLAQALADISGEFTAIGALNMAGNVMSDLTHQTVTDYIAAISTYVSTAGSELQALYERNLAYLMNHKDDLGAEFDTMMAELQTSLATRLAEVQNTALTHAATTLGPSLISALQSGKLNDADKAFYKNMIDDMLGKVDFSKLSTEARAAYLELKSIFSPMPLAFYTITSDAMARIESAIGAGTIGAEDKAKILEAALTGGLADLKAEFIRLGNDAAASLIDEIIGLSPEAKAAAQAYMQSVANGIQAGLDTGRITGEIADKIRAAAQVGNLQGLADEYRNMGDILIADFIEGIIAGSTNLAPTFDSIRQAAINAMGGNGSLVAKMFATGSEAAKMIASGLLSKEVDVLQASAIMQASAEGTLPSLIEFYKKNGNTSAATLAQSLLDKCPEVKAAADKVAAAAKIPDKSSESQTTGKNIISGLILGMSSLMESLKAKAAELARAALSKFKSIFKPGSPSKVMIALGEQIGQGLALGIYDTTRLVVSAADAMSGAVLNAYGGIEPQLMANKELAASAQYGVEATIAGSEGRMANIIEEATRSAVSQVLDRLNVTLNVDGTTLGNVSIRAINDAQRRANRILLEM